MKRSIALLPALVLIFVAEGWCQQDATTYVFRQRSETSAAPYRLLPKDYHVYSGTRYELPRIPANETYAENAKLIESLADVSTVDAFAFWFKAVMPDSWRPAFDTEGVPRWDYKAIEEGRRFRTDSENAGNLNFGLTGTFLFGKIFDKVGIGGDAKDEGIKWIIRLGGGAVQVFSDVSHLRWKRDDRVWYGEEDKDIPQIKAGFEHARYLQLERLAARAGFRLNPIDFGVKEFEDVSYSYLFKKPLRFDDLQDPFAPSEEDRQEERRRRDWELEQERQRRERSAVPIVIP